MFEAKSNAVEVRAVNPIASLAQNILAVNEAELHSGERAVMGDLIAGPQPLLRQVAGIELTGYEAAEFDAGLRARHHPAGDAADIADPNIFDGRCFSGR